MRIAFIGKGGAGKTTTACLFAQLCSMYKQTFLIDSDINQHVVNTLGMDNLQGKTLSSITAKIREHVAGKNPPLPAEYIRMTTPANSESVMIQPSVHDPILSQCIDSMHSSLHVIRVGEFEQEDIGHICYHGKSLALEMVLNHLVDTTNEVFIADLGAGADIFSTGMYLKYDAIAIVAEPSMKSIEVIRQCQKYLFNHPIPLLVIANKIENNEDRMFFEENSPIAPSIFLTYDGDIKRKEQGRPYDEQHKEKHIQLLHPLLQKLESITKDWNLYHTNLCNLHEAHAHSWLNTSFGVDFTKQIQRETCPYIIS